MRHRVAYRKLGRVTPHRIALLRNLATALFERERISTTLMKAKELRPYAERLITQAKREDDRLHARRLVLREIHDPVVLKKLFDDLGARFASRAGGYTRILRLGPRKGDGAEMAIVELIGSEYKPEKPDKGKKAAAAKGEKGEKGEKAAKEKGEKADVAAPRPKGGGKGRGAQPGSTRRNTPRKVGSS
jgi:large subunit ribosomal protein L17